MGPWLAWIGKISIATLIAIVALVHTIYSSEQNRQIAEDQLEAAQSPPKPQGLSVQDIRRIANELHRLQQEVQIKPPKSGRDRGAKRKHGKRRP